MLQKELLDKLVDEACGDAVKDNHAGLCEYVVPQLIHHHTESCVTENITKST